MVLEKTMNQDPEVSNWMPSVHKSMAKCFVTRRFLRLTLKNWEIFGKKYRFGDFLWVSETDSVDRCFLEIRVGRAFVVALETFKFATLQ